MVCYGIFWSGQFERPQVHLLISRCMTFSLLSLSLLLKLPNSRYSAPSVSAPSEATVIVEPLDDFSRKVPVAAKDYST